MSEVEQEPSKKKSFLTQVCSAVGLLLGWYSGINLLIPAIIFIPLRFVLRKKLKQQPNNNFIDPFSFIFAHMGWIVIGTLLFYNSLPQNIVIMNSIEIIMFLLVAFILLLKPKKVIFIITLCLEGSATLLNLYQIISVPLNSNDHKSVLVHFVIRLCVIITAIIAYRKMENDNKDRLNYQTVSNRA